VRTCPFRWYTLISAELEGRKGGSGYRDHVDPPIVHQENSRFVFVVFVSGKGSLMSLSLENASFECLCFEWVSLALDSCLRCL
jgi:hypothetical protein